MAVWLDARIALWLLSSDLAPAPQADASSVLLTVGGAGRDWAVTRDGGWAAVRHLDADMAGAAAGVHPSGCTCCAGRSRLALALSELFRQRACGELGLFRQVLLAVPAAELDLAGNLLGSDPVVTARYRVTQPLG